MYKNHKEFDMSKTNCSPYIYYTTNSRKLLSTLWNARKWHFQGVKGRFQKLFIPKFRLYQYLCTHSILVKKFSIIVIHMSSTQKCKYIGTLKIIAWHPSHTLHQRIITVFPKLLTTYATTVAQRPISQYGRPLKRWGPQTHEGIFCHF